MNRAWWVLQSVFMLSGACSLAYEIVWGRWLVAILGGSTMAACVVLTAYMGGLAAGAWFFGRLSARIASPLKAYLAVEIAIGLVALSFPTIAQHVIGLSSGLRIGLAVFLLLLPTFFMGGTVPLVMSWSQQVGLEEGKTLGRLYGLNTIGAALGCLLTGFVLIPNIGLELTNILAATHNLLIALVIYLMLRLSPESSGADEAAQADAKAEANSGASPESSGSDEAAQAADSSGLPAPQAASRDDDGPKEGWPLHTIAFLSGAMTLGLEVLWIRLLRITLGSTTYIFTLVIATFILGIGVGGLWAERTGAKEAIEKKLTWAQLLLLCLLLVQFVALPYSQHAFSVYQKFSSHWLFSLFGTSLLCVVLLLPVTLVIGVMFPLLGRLYMQRGHRGTEVGVLYAVNTAGAVAGSIATTLVLIPWIGTAHSFLLLVGGMIVSLGLYIRLAQGDISRFFFGCAGLFGCGFVACVAWQPGWSIKYLAGGAFFGEKAKTHQVLFFREGRMSTVVVEKWDGKLGLRVDGKPVASSVYIDRTNQLLLGHLPAMLTEKIERGLVVGLGTGMTLGSLALHQLKHLELVELEPQLYKAAHYFRKYNNDVLSRYKPKITFDDGFNYVHATPHRYEVITSDPIQPYFRGAATLYSVDYFERTRDRLQPSGVMAHWLPLANMSAFDFKMIARSFVEVYPYARLYWTGGLADALLVGRRTPWQGISKLQYRRAAGALKSVYIGSPEEMGALLIAGRRVLKKWAGHGVLNTVNLPLLEFTAPKALHIDTAWSNLRILLALRRHTPRRDAPWRAINALLAYKAHIRHLKRPLLARKLLLGLVGCASFVDCELLKASRLLHRLACRLSMEVGDQHIQRAQNLRALRQRWWSRGSGLAKPQALREALKQAVDAYHRSFQLVKPAWSEERRRLQARSRALSRFFPKDSPEAKKLHAILQ